MTASCQFMMILFKFFFVYVGPCSSADSSFEEDSLAENVKKRLFGSYSFAVFFLLF